MTFQALPGTSSFRAWVAGGNQTKTVTVTSTGANTVGFSTVAVTVTVVDPVAADIVAANVQQAGNTGIFGPRTAVNANGQVTFQALPGTSSFRAWVAGGNQTKTVTVTSTGANTVVFSTVAVTVTVKSPSGAPRTVATVTHAGNTGVFGPKMPVNINGQVTFQSLPGTNTFTAWLGFSSSTKTLTISSATTLNIVL